MESDTSTAVLTADQSHCLGAQVSCSTNEHSEQNRTYYCVYRA
jgi:hypothetical protein